MAVDPDIQQRAAEIRNANYGGEITETIAKGLESMSEVIVNNTNRQGDVETQFQQVIEETTDKDIVSAPEIIAARNGESNLKERLDKENQSVTAQLAQKITQGIGGVMDADLSQGVKLQMTGGSVAVVGTNAILTNTVVDNQIVPKKTTFAKMSSNVYNKLTDSVGKVMLSDGSIVDNADYSLSDHIFIPPNSTVFFYGAPNFSEFDAQGVFIRRINIPTNEGQFILTPQTYSVRVNFQPSLGVMYNSARVNIGGKKTYEPYHIKIDSLKIPDDFIGTQNIQNKAITSDKQTALGDVASITPGLPFSLPNIDMTNMRVQFYGNTYITLKKTRYDLTTDIDVDFSSIWTNGGLVPIIYFNTTSKTFKVLALNNLGSVLEDDVFIMIIYKNSDTMEYFGATCTFDYTVNGRKPKGQEKKYYFVPDNLVGMVKMPVKTYATTDIDTPEKINQKFSELTATQNGYLTHTLLGKDASGVHDIYKLSLKPKRVADVENIRDVPKIIFTCGVHGGEKGSVYATYYFIKALCENWAESDLLEYLRFNVRFEIIYLANPWGFLDSNNKAETWWGRYNANMIDINRNMPFAWTLNAMGSSTYGGESAGSEVESQYIKNMIDENKDALHMFDYHTNGSSGSAWDTLAYIDISKKPAFDYDMTVAAQYQIEKFTREATKDYNLQPDTDFLGFIHRSLANGRVNDYAQSVGLPSLSIETWRKFPHEIGFYSSDTIKASAEYLGSWIINAIRQLKQ